MPSLLSLGCAASGYSLTPAAPPPPRPPQSAPVADPRATWPRFDPPPGEATDRCSDRLSFWRQYRETLLATPALTEEAFEQNESRMRREWENCQGSVERDAAQKEQWAALREREKKNAADREARKQHREAEERALEAADEAAAGDPKWMVPLLSAQLCQSSDDRAEAMNEIRTQKKYSKVGGVLDLTAISAQQDRIRDADERSAALREDLHTLRAKPLPCSSADVVFVRHCAGWLPANAPEECRNDRARQFQRLADRR